MLINENITKKLEEKEIEMKKIKEIYKETVKETIEKSEWLANCENLSEIAQLDEKTLVDKIENNAKLFTDILDNLEKNGIDVFGLGENGELLKECIEEMSKININEYVKNEQIDDVEEDIEDDIELEERVGKIEYYGFEGEIVEIVEYTDRKKFEEDVEDDNYCGRHIRATSYGDTSLDIENFDPPIRFEIKKMNSDEEDIEDDIEDDVELEM